MTNQAGSTGEKRNDDGEGRIRMTQHLNGQKRAADWADNRVNRIPNGIDPRDFVGEEFQTIKESGNNDNRRMTQEIECLIGGSKRDPVKMDRQTGYKNSQVKIDAGERGEPESNAEKIEPFHKKNISAQTQMSRALRVEVLRG